MRFHDKPCDCRFRRNSRQAAQWLTRPEPEGEIGLAAIQVRRQERLVVKLAQAMHGLGLPPQQREVALLIAQGKSNQEIAQALSVSPNTASYHIKQLFMRLDAHERSEALQKILAS